MGRIRQLTRAAPASAATTLRRRLTVRFAQLLTGAGICALVAVAAFLVYGAFDDSVLEEENARLAITVAVLGTLSLTGGVALLLLCAILRTLEQIAAALREEAAPGEHHARRTAHRGA